MDRIQWKRTFGAVAVIAAATGGPMIASAGNAMADSGIAVADDGCTFSSVGGSCSDPGPVGNALIAVREFAKSLGYGTGSSSGTAYFL
ncbi:hypothetical protein DFR71_1492 [Nocardia alba]|uniref:Uncharacterized protein n=1 Tax=Nocardia alba TaxID=225051 RepID=A0A4R1G8Y6_9NOCA|nr:hypothetical protein DFR71_1492 [Nocardia alba]